MSTAHPALPVVPMRRHAAVRWSAGERAAMARALEPFGVTLTVLSDVRERCGLPRLSGTDPRVRWAAPHILRGARGQAALAAVRAERELLTAAIASLDADAVYHARRLLNLRRSTPSCLRLNELRSLYAQGRICELTNAERAPLALAA